MFPSHDMGGDISIKNYEVNLSFNEVDFNDKYKNKSETEKKKLKEKEKYILKSEEKINFKKDEEKVITIKSGIGDVLHIGENSTTVTIYPNSTHNKAYRYYGSDPGSPKAFGNASSMTIFTSADYVNLTNDDGSYTTTAGSSPYRTPRLIQHNFEFNLSGFSTDIDNFTVIWNGYTSYSLS